MAVYLGRDKVGVTKELGTDRLQWKCDNVKSLYYEFYNYTGADLSILQGLDTSKVTNMNRMFNGCSNIVNVPELDCSNNTSYFNMFASCTNLKSVSFKNMNKPATFQGIFSGCVNLENFNNLDLFQATNMGSSFSRCEKIKEIKFDSTSMVTDMANCFSGCKALETLELLDCSNVTNMGSVCGSCTNLKNVNIKKTGKVTTFNQAFQQCTNLETIEFDDTSSCQNFFRMFMYDNKLKTVRNLNFINATSGNIAQMFYGSSSVENLDVKNIKWTFDISSLSKLTLDSLVHTIQQLWNLTGSTSQTLTMSTASKNLIADVYVKLVEPTAEQIEADPNIIYKKNCVVCESTDEGAMTITEYATSKNWAIA